MKLSSLSLSLEQSVYNEREDSVKLFQFGDFFFKSCIYSLDYRNFGNVE